MSDPIKPGLKSISNIIAIGSGKGGVGKSTVTANIAYALNKIGYRVGVLDADIYGPSQQTLLGVGHPQMSEGNAQGSALLPVVKNGIKYISMSMLMKGDGPVVWRAPMAVKIIQQFLHQVSWGTLDYLFIDLPPGTGDIQLTLTQQASLTGAIIVTTPQQMAVGIAQKGLAMFKSVKVPILGIVENMAGFDCPKCGELTPIFAEGGGKELAQKFNTTLLGSIPLDPKVVLAGDSGENLISKYHGTPAAAATKSIAEAVIKATAGLAGDSLGIEPRKLEVNQKGNLAITWGDDGISREYQAHSLRANCRCASCMDEFTGQKKIDPKDIPSDIVLKSLQRVGRYAVSLRFSDTHSTGIYTFESLRQ